MNIDNSRVEALVLQSLKEVREQRGVPVLEEPTRETVLFGLGGELDSLGLVNLVISLEERISDELGVQIALTDERAMSQEHSPFRTVTVLANYISQLLDGQEHA
jgi:acyl carrier protein